MTTGRRFLPNSSARPVADESWQQQRSLHEMSQNTMNNDATPSWSDLSALDECFMTAAEGCLDSIAKLTRSLAEADFAQMAVWPGPIREFWHEGLELALDALDRRQLADTEIAFLNQLARSGFDTALFRDMLAGAIRRRFQDYLDPAALLAAMGVHDPAVTTTEIAGRWDVFQHLAPGIRCHHPAHGIGTVREIDVIGNEVHVMFDKRKKFSLQIALSAIVCIRQDSMVERLLRGQVSWEEAIAEENHLSLLQHSFVPVTDDWAQLESVFVPAIVSNAEFTGLAGTVTTADDTDQTEPQDSGERCWYEARSLAELVDLIDKLDNDVVPPPPSTERLREILRTCAAREDQARLLSQAVARLWRIAADQPWLVEILQEISADTVAWRKRRLFVTLSDKLPGKLTPHWNDATVAANGPDYLASACMDLPLRLWIIVERSLGRYTNAHDRLREEVTRRLRASDVSSDMLLWLWKTKHQERQVLANPPLLFRTLAKPVHGSFIKARKDLRKLLLEDTEFQRHVLRNGGPRAVSNLVRCIRHLPLLDAGEQQSLLVKIVRLFPAAKPLVEQRRQAPARKAVGKFTSARSFELRRRELTELINVKIPANSRAIAHAREYGDLRENAEYKAAKEEQAYLGARRAELEEALQEIRATDFADVVVSGQAVPGCTVTVEHTNGITEQFFLLGLWDSVPEKQMVSYDTPVGRVLLGAQTGDVLEMPAGTDAVVAEISPLPDDVLAWLSGEDLHPQS